MYTNEYAEITEIGELELAFSSAALFDQYDEVTRDEAANDDSYDNLYPYLA